MPVATKLESYGVVCNAPALEKLGSLRVQIPTGSIGEIDSLPSKDKQRS